MYPYVYNWLRYADTVTGKTTAGTGRMNAKAASPATRSSGFTSS